MDATTTATPSPRMIAAAQLSIPRPASRGSPARPSRSATGIPARPDPDEQRTDQVAVPTELNDDEDGPRHGRNDGKGQHPSQVRDDLRPPASRRGDDRLPPCVVSTRGRVALPERNHVGRSQVLDAGSLTTISDPHSIDGNCRAASRPHAASTSHLHCNPLRGPGSAGAMSRPLPYAWHVAPEGIRTVSAALTSRPRGRTGVADSCHVLLQHPAVSRAKLLHCEGLALPNPLAA